MGVVRSIGLGGWYVIGAGTNCMYYSILKLTDCTALGVEARMLPLTSRPGYNPAKRYWLLFVVDL